MKYLNKLSTIIENFKFFWNLNEINLSLICPDENSVKFNYELGYDSQKVLKSLNTNHKKTLLIKIDNKYYYNNNKSIKEYEKIEYEFRKFDHGTIKLNVIKDISQMGYKNTIIDGAHIYIKNRNINYKAITKCLGGRTGGDSGTFGVGEKSEYGGHPIFEIYLNKNNKQFQLPQDKSNIKPTLIGEKILLFCKYKAKEIFNNKPLSSCEVRTITNKMKTEVWKKSIGDKFYGYCYACEKTIQAAFDNTIAELHFGHIISYNKCRESKPNNLIPLCKTCNTSMGDQNAIDWIKEKFPNNKIEIKLDNYLKQYPIKQ